MPTNKLKRVIYLTSEEYQRLRTDGRATLSTGTEVEYSDADAYIFTDPVVGGDHTDTVDATLIDLVGAGSGINGAKTTSGGILTVGADNYLSVGDLAAVDKVSTAQLDDTLSSIVNRTMNETQFELDSSANQYSLKNVYGGTSADVESEKKVTTKIQVRYDTWDNWKAASASGKGALYVPLAGEICAVKIDATATPAGDTGTSTSIHEAMFKIGDGETTFQDLEWASAKAADVYGWAKQEKIPITITTSPSTLTGEGTYLSDVTNNTSDDVLSLSFTKKDNMVTTDSEQTLVSKKTFAVQDEQEKTEKDMIVLHVDSGDKQRTPTADLMKLGMSVSDTSDAGESYGYVTLHSENTGSRSDLTISSDRFTYTGVNRNGGKTYEYKFPLNTLGTSDHTTTTLLTNEDILSGSIADNLDGAQLVRSLQVVNYVNNKFDEMTKVTYSYDSTTGTLTISGVS